MPKVCASGSIWLTAVIVGGTMAFVAACSKGTPSAAQATPAGSRAALTARIGNACNRKLLTTADVAGILNKKITGTRSIEGVPEACEFTTAGPGSITVTLRPGLGKMTVDTWKSGRMPTPAAPLSGVGDEAAWVDELNEVIAEKNDLLCDIQVSGITRDLMGSTTDQQNKIGALCNKIFAAMQ